MIRRKFVPPNFRCVVALEAPGSQDEEMLACAASEADLRERLRKQGFVVKALEPYDFEKWKAKARRARDKALQDPAPGKSREFDSEIWGALKRYLFSLFDDKCAYCETKPLAGAWGDVEHFRPKKKVEEDPAHPGYYWLAYDLDNLFPCCQRCNQARGKLNHFPVSGIRAKTPDDELGAEAALLLNPYQDEYRAHLKFHTYDPAGFTPATASGVNPKGDMSVRIYNLNRQELVTERRATIESFRIKLEMAAIHKTLRQVKEEVEKGTNPHATACLEEYDTWLRLKIAELQQNLDNPGGTG
jgi:hypothetical protein